MTLSLYEVEMLVFFILFHREGAHHDVHYCNKVYNHEYGNVVRGLIFIHHSFLFFLLHDRLSNMWFFLLSSQTNDQPIYANM